MLRAYKVWKAASVVVFAAGVCCESGLRVTMDTSSIDVCGEVLRETVCCLPIYCDSSFAVVDADHSREFRVCAPECRKTSPPEARVCSESGDGPLGEEIAWAISAILDVDAAAGLCDGRTRQGQLDFNRDRCAGRQKVEAEAVSNNGYVNRQRPYSFRQCEDLMSGIRTIVPDAGHVPSQNLMVSCVPSIKRAGVLPVVFRSSELIGVGSDG